MHKDWHSRGYLPHFDAPGIVQAVTFRLADSLPREAVERLLGARPSGARPSSAAFFLEAGGDARAPGERRREVEGLLDAGHGSYVLRDPRVAQIVEDALLHFDGDRYRLLAWVVMPNHVHLVTEILPGQALSAILHGWKSFTARQINALLGRCGRLWQPDYFDRYVRDENHLGRAIDYVEHNPVTAGLAERPEDWPWGSARRRALEERGRPRPLFGAP